MPAHPQHAAPAAGLMASAALTGDPALAAILAALLDGRPLTAGELGHVAGVGTATASAHLARLLAGGVITAVEQGGHRYYRLAGPAAIAVSEEFAKIGPRPRVRAPRQSRQAAALAAARTCYGHLAGRAGVALHAALLDSEVITPKLAEGGTAATPHPAAPPEPVEYEVTKHGARTLAAFGIDLDATRRSRRRFAGACLDWTQRRPHLNGALGAALTARLLDLGWCERGSSRRALRITESGVKGLAETFGCVITN